MSEPLARLRGLTPARIGLGRAGLAAKTNDLLELGLDHARARDAVHEELEVHRIVEQLETAGVVGAALELHSEAALDRRLYLMRPDLGRRLTVESRTLLSTAEPRPDIVVVLGDGLSARATHEYGAMLVKSLRDELSELRFARSIVVRGARVAIADEIGEALGASLAVILLGERPGLSTAESLGAYLTFAPRRGRSDAERNCVSNIHRRGLLVAEATKKLAFLARAALAQQRSGVPLKDVLALESR